MCSPDRYSFSRKVYLLSNRKQFSRGDISVHQTGFNFPESPFYDQTDTYLGHAFQLLVAFGWLKM